MKVLLVVLFVGASVSALQNQYSPYNKIDDESGQYVPDDSGQYIPDDSGRYIPDNSGDYAPDGLGLYSPDGSGNYKGDNGAYKGDPNSAYRGDDNNGRYRDFGANGFGRGGSSSKLSSSSFNSFGSSSLLGQGSNQNKEVVKTVPFTGAGHSGAASFGSGSGSNNAFGSIPAATSQIVVPVSKVPIRNVRYDQGRYADGHWKIISQSGDVDTDGYHWAYETENGISAEESGKLHNKGTDHEAMKAKGFFQYTGPDIVLYQVTYTADENGFIPTGSHIPTPPPIPGLIAKALDYLKTTGKL